MSEISEQALDARARRAARHVGLMARKSRWRCGTIDNLGGYRLIDPQHIEEIPAQHNLRIRRPEGGA